MEKIFPKASDIKGFRTVADTEIIGKVIPQTDGSFRVESPLRLLTGRNPEDGTLIVDMVPITLLTDALVFTRESMMCLPFTLDKEMEDAYLQRTTDIPGLTL